MIPKDRAIRIALLSKPLDNWKSGSGHHLDELMKTVLDLNDGTFEFTFVHYRKSDNPIYGRVREIIIPRNPFAASRILAKEKFDIIHYSPLSVYAPIWGIRAKKIATVHGIEEVLFPQGYSPVQRWHDTLIQPWYMRRMDRIATVSETGRQYFIKHYRIPAQKVFITTNGLGKKYRVLSDDQKKPTGISALDRPFILHISKFSLRKNPLTICRGFARFLQKSGLDYQLVCAGSGWNGSEAQAIAAEAGISDRYIAPGFISEEAAVNLLNNAQAFVFPSFAEGFGMPNIEAMACGCPVLTSNIFAIPEVVGDAACILGAVDDIDEFGAALSRICSDPAYKKTLIDRGLERIKRYTWDISAKALISAYRSMIVD